MSAPVLSAMNLARSFSNPKKWVFSLRTVSTGAKWSRVKMNWFGDLNTFPGKVYQSRNTWAVKVFPCHSLSLSIFFEFLRGIAYKYTIKSFNTGVTN